MAKYSDDRNIQILISVLKHNNIKKVIASPGSTNMGFVASIQSDDFFEIYSCVDERSACYMACGLAEESGEPVVLTCTGATASRNYMSGLTEAYYRKLPILAVTSAQHFSKIGNNNPQSLDRTQQLKDIVNLSVQIPVINCKDDEIGVTTLINKAVIELKHRGEGPVHINIVSTSESSKNFNTTELPYTRFIDRISYEDKFPELNPKKIAIYIGAHKRIEEKLVSAIEEFCEKYNAVVLCDHTSNYYGKYKIMSNIIFDQDNYSSDNNNFQLLIHLGDVSGSYCRINCEEVWRVNQDGEVRDTFSKLTKVFEMTEFNFFKEYNKKEENLTDLSNYKRINIEYVEMKKMIENIDFKLSNIYTAKIISKKIPNDSYMHLAILNSLRSWNYFEVKNKVHFVVNTGGFGIDGPMSTTIGASFNNKEKNYYMVLGDLAFFYDLNSVGNKNVKNNLRILLINNGCGTEFHNYTHPASLLGKMSEAYIAADGHFGNKSNSLVKNYVESLGFEYFSVNTKEEFNDLADYYCEPNIHEKPLVIEVFTKSEDESDSLKSIRTQKEEVKTIIKNKIKNMFSDKTKKTLKRILNK